MERETGLEPATPSLGSWASAEVWYRIPGSWRQPLPSTTGRVLLGCGICQTKPGCALSMSQVWERPGDGRKGGMRRKEPPHSGLVNPSAVTPKVQTPRILGATAYFDDKAPLDQIREAGPRRSGG
jgi:hypothetical protein